MQIKRKQQGFTLIELVVVIIILGILAVTAAPKFINLQSDARQASLQGVKGAIQGANGLVFARAAIDGHEKKAIADWGTDEGVDIGAEELAVTNFGYLQADMDEFNNAIDADFGAVGSDSEWIVVADTSSTPTLTITQNGSPAEVTGTDATACKLVYTEAADANTIPTYVITDNGC
ncbi:type II secretion system protein [Shewanella sp. 10N.286.51.B2]|uniref:type II secretion system protein n=1 Tax=Shewanella sp. 10N.286.51.B2 TaxID=3229707 RepID=UPI00354C8AD4